MNANKYTEIGGNRWLDAGSESLPRAVESNTIELFSLFYSRLFVSIRGASLKVGTTRTITR